MSGEYVPMIVAAGMLVLACILLVIVLVTWRRRASENRPAPPERPAAADEADRPRVVTRGRPQAEPSGPAPQEAREPAAARIAELRRLLDEADERIAALRELTGLAAPSGRAGSEGRPSPADCRDEILRLHSQGMDALRIARRMDLDVGEVHLVLRLHKDQTPAPGQSQA